MRKTIVLILAIAASAVASTTFAADFGREKVAQWGDPFTAPQTRTRCVSMAWGRWPWGGEWHTCNGWATDVRTMQVVVYSKALGPDNLSQSAIAAVNEAAKVCGALAGASAITALAGTPSPEIAARIVNAYASASGTFSACIGTKASDLSAVGVGTAVLKLAFDTETFWSKWSNE